MTVINGLLTSRRFWISVLTLVVTAAGAAFPQITPAVVQAFQVFALALIVAFTIDDTAKTIASKDK